MENVIGEEEEEEDEEEEACELIPYAPPPQWAIINARWRTLEKA